MEKNEGKDEESGEEDEVEGEELPRGLRTETGREIETGRRGATKGTSVEFLPLITAKVEDLEDLELFMATWYITSA